MAPISADERETVLTMSDADDVVRVWSAQRRQISALRANPLWTEIRSGSIEGTPFAEFTAPAEGFIVAKGAKRTRNVSDEARAARSERMRAIHAAK